MASPDQFPTTDWARLDALRLGNETTRKEVLGELFERYHRPIIGFLNRKGYSPERADDLMQDFFLYCIEKQVFEKADRQRSRFRNLVLGALNNYAANVHRHNMAQIRQPAGGIVSADELAEQNGEAAPLGIEAQTPEDAFHLAWAQALLSRVVSALEKDLMQSRRHAHFVIFQRCVLAPILGGDSAPSHKELAAELGLSAEKEVANHLVTAKRAYQRLLRAEIAAYAPDEAAIDGEIKDLFKFLSRRA